MVQPGTIFTAEALESLPTQSTLSADLLEALVSNDPNAVQILINVQTAIAREKDALKKANLLQAMRQFATRHAQKLLPLLFRVWGKVISRRLLYNWGTRLPPTISGGLPKRSCTHLALRTSLQIESSNRNMCSIGGYVLDITKCFNGFPRLPILWLLESQGLSHEHRIFWERSMEGMSRVVQIADSTSFPMFATSGLAEGDPVAVCAMAQVARLWHCVIIKCESFPSSFADNWSWYADSALKHIESLRATHSLLKALKLTSDPQKCWSWGTDAASRKMWQTISTEIFGSPRSIKVALTEKDLGIQMHYAQVTHLGCLASRIEDGLLRLRRLWHAPYAIWKKGHLLQTGIYPAMFYGAFSSYIGRKKFSAIRTLMGDAILHRTSNTNPFLLSSLLATSVIDPFLYVLREVLSVWFTFLWRHPSDMEWVYQILATASNCVQKACGPASVLRCYLQIIEWDVDEHGRIIDHMGLRWFLHQMTWPAICDRIHQAWNEYVSRHVRKRNPFQEMPTIELGNSGGFDFEDPRTSKAIVLHQTLSPIYQVQKLKWNNSWVTEEVDNSDVMESHLCPMCNKPDAHQHFIFECQGTQDIREQFQSTFEFFKHKQPWTFMLPVMWKHPHHDALVCLDFQKTMPDSFAIDPGDQVPHFYVDGSCTAPSSKYGRQASFAIIHDAACDDSVGKDLAYTYQISGVCPSALTCVQASLVPGVLTINRAEFAALVQIVRSTQSAVIYTDSKVAMTLFQEIQDFTPSGNYVKHSCFDLIRDLETLFAEREPTNFIIHKIKAHRDDGDASDLLDLYNILGNRLADKSAKQVLLKDDIPVICFAQAVASFYCEHREMLQQLLACIAAMDAKRMDAWDSKDNGVAQNDVKNDIADKDWSGYISLVPDVFSPEVYNAFQPGPRFLARFVGWARKLKWPMEQRLGKMSHECISFQELVVNLVLTTQLGLPRVVSRGSQTGHCCYGDPADDTCYDLIPISMTDAVRLVIHTYKYLEKYWNIPIFPEHARKQSKMLCWMGNRTITSGFALRPWLPF